MRREELVEIVGKVMNGEGSEEDTRRWVRIIEENVPMRDVADLLFWSDLSPEQVVDKALAADTYSAIELPPGNSADE